MNFQIVNVPSPNTPHNTCVFSIFEAPDSTLNLQIVADWFAASVVELERESWK